MADSSPFVGLPANAPESVKARLMAARLLAEGAAQQERPYTSGAVVGLKAISGLLGGLQEHNAIQEAQQGQASQRAMMASYLMNGASPGALGQASPAAVAAAGQASATGIPGSAAVAAAGQPAPQSTDARDLAIRTIYGEAGGEPAQGQAGVAAVLKNRLAGGQYGNDMQSVIMAPKQFSLWNKGDPAGDSARALDPSSPAYQKIGGIYDGVMSGQIADPTGGATHYYNPNVASPAWGPQLAQQNDVRIGNHRFVGTGPAGPNGASSTATAQADAPAANAQPVASNTLPPGVTPDMVSAPGTPPGVPPSPFGGMPPSMAQPPASPDSATLAAALRGSAGSGPGATPLPATAQQPSPFGAMPSSMDQASAGVPAPSMAGAPPPSPQGSPFGAGPSPMAPQGGADPKLVAQLLAQGGASPSGPPASPFGAGPAPMQGQGGADPAMVAGLLQRGAPTSPAPDPSLMGAGAPPAPQAPSLSPSALAMGDLAPSGPGPGALDPSAGAQPAAGLSTGQLPGMDNFAPDGSVRQTSIVNPGDPNSTPGFTGSFGPGIQPQVSGTLPSPDMLAQGAADMPAPSQPSPAVMAAALRNVPAAPSAAPTSSPAPQVPPQAPAPIPTTPAPAAQQAAALMPGAVDDFGRTPDQAMAGGSPLPNVTTAAMAKAGYDTTGLPGAAPQPAAPPLPTLAGANVPPPDLSGLAGPSTPPPGSGLPIMARQSSNPPAALQQDFAGLGQGQAQSQPTGAYSTEPSSRPGAQAARTVAAGVPLPPSRPSDTALGLDPDAPAPNAVQAGPAPVSPQMMGNLLRRQPMGLAGNSPTSDPSSAQNFNLQEAQRAQGGAGYTNPAARALAGQTSASPPQAQPQDSSPLDGIGRLFGQSGGQGGGLGGMLGNLPVIGGLLGGQQPGVGPNGQAAGSSANGGQGQAQSFTPGGQGTPAGQQAQGGQGAQAQVPGLGMSQSQAIALLSNPYTSPAQAELIMNRLSPQPMKLSQGEGLVGRRQDGTYGNLYTQAPTADWSYDHDAGTITNKATGEQRKVGAAPVTMSPGQVRIGDGGNVTASVPATPDYKPVPGTGTAMNSRDGSSIALPGGAGASVHTMKVNGVDVPIRITPDPNGGQPKVELMTPGGGGGAPQSGAAPAGPLDGIAPLVKQAGQMKADEAAQVKDADTQVGEQAKIAQAGRDARGKLAQLDQLEQLSGKFGNNIGTKLAAKFNEYGLPNQSGTDQEAFKGMVGALAVGERPAGSGSLRVAEMDAFKSNLGDLSTNQAGRIAAINRYRTILQRDAQMGDLASDPTLSPMDRAVQLRTLSQTPYAQVGGTDGGGAPPPAPGAPPTASASPQATQGAAPADAIAQAQAAIARGAPRAAVIQRLQSAGINPTGL